MKLFLVGFLSTKDEPPTVTEVGIFSEASPTLYSGGVFPFAIVSVEHPSFERAKEALLGMLEHPTLEWAKNLLREGDRS